MAEVVLSGGEERVALLLCQVLHHAERCDLVVVSVSAVLRLSVPLMPLGCWLTVVAVNACICVAQRSDRIHASAGR